MSAARPDAAVQLGELTPAHRQELEALVRATGAFRENEVAVALEVFDAAMAVDADYTLLGAFAEEGGLAGYVGYGPTPCTLGTWDLYWIAVDPAAQRRGVGTALLDEVERRLWTQGARMLVIETSSRSDYAATRGFYRARGYLPVARVPDFYEPGDDRMIYVKHLGSSGESA